MVPGLRFYLDSRASPIVLSSSGLSHCPDHLHQPSLVRLKQDLAAFYQAATAR